MNSPLLGYLRLARPANLPTAAADIVAGAAIAGLFTVPWIRDGIWLEFILLLFSSVFLYAGGVALNDFFDFRLDSVERPERPIPSGVVSVSHAALYGGLLLLTGIALAACVDLSCGAVAFLLCLAILTYDAFAKNSAFFGPLTMGICRGLNLLLGMSLMAEFDFIFMALIPIVYIAAITMISQGEVHGNNKKNLLLAAFLYLIVILSIACASAFWKSNSLQALPFLVLFAFLIFKPLIKAYRENSPENIKKSVKAGVISLIVMDACLATAFSFWWVGLLTLLLLPLSIYLSKAFAVT